MTGPDRFGVVALAAASGADPNTGYDNYPVWSPDGTKISFTSLQNNDDIHMMNSGGTGQTSLATNMATDFESDWQPLNTGITAHTLPFSQDWSDTGLRATNVRIGGTRRYRPSEGGSAYEAHHVVIVDCGGQGRSVGAACGGSVTGAGSGWVEVTSVVWVGVLR